MMLHNEIGLPPRTDNGAQAAAGCIALHAIIADRVVDKGNIKMKIIPFFIP
jgi:hypothetical protein